MENFQFASFWERFLASIIDSILLLMIIGSIFYFMYGISFMEKVSKLNTVNVFLNYIVPLMGTLLFWHYTSATPGKTFFQIKIVDAETLEKPTTKQLFIRYISYIISFIPLGLGFFWVIWDKRKQGWHDKLAGTVLIEPKTEAKKISFFGYIGRTIGISLGILSIMSMMFIITIALLSTKGKIPDSSLYSVKRLDKDIAKELVDKKIINNTQELLYLNPNSYFSFTKSGTAIVKDGIISYETLENEKSKSTKFYFKDMSTLELDVENIYLTMGMLTITIYDEGDLVFFEALMPKNIKAEELKKELLDLWNTSKIFAISSYPSDIHTLESLDVDGYITHVKKEMNANKDSIVDLISIGYHNYIEDKDLFSRYNSEVLNLLHDNTWKNKSMATSSKMWTDMLSKTKLNKESFDAFFEQLETLDTLDKDKNSTWNMLANRLPTIYLYFMDKQLQRISHSQIEVPLIELYKKDNSIIKDMNTSRHYLVSEVYVRMSEFCDDAEEVLCSDEEYAKKAVESSSLNPNALFRYAYELDDNPKNIEMLEDLLALTKTSQELFDISMDAVYNNLGYNIYSDSQVEKYDDALIYLQKAYDLNNQSVYSLATMSGIYRERKEYKLAYSIMKDEAYMFLHASDDELLEKENTYWIFAKGLASTSFEFKDYNTTKYVCERYLKLHDSDYEECHDYLKEIKKLSSDVVPMYSFWKL